MLVNVLNSKLFYISVKSSEHQICMIRNECFDCSQKEHTQKNYLMHLFEKICFLLNSEMNWSMNSISWINMKINTKSSASFAMKIMKLILNLIMKHIIISWVLIMIAEIALIMKLIMKSAAKSVTNMNMHINLSKNTWTVFMKKICIVLFVMSWIMSLNESENELFWNQVTFQNIIEKNLWYIYASWALIRTTEVIHLLTWLAKYDFKKNELRYKFW